MTETENAVKQDGKRTQTKDLPVAAVRLPEEVLTWFRHQAVENKRSLGAELAFRLEQSRQVQLGRGVQ